MSPFIQNGHAENSIVLNNDDDMVYNDIIENITLTNAYLETIDKDAELTDNKKLKDKLQAQDDEVRKLQDILDEKSKHLRALNEQLECKKADLHQYKNQALSNYQSKSFQVNIS